MEKLCINGGKKLVGKTAVHGAKNSVLPILAATLLVDDISTLHNCPLLTDVRYTVDILNKLGCNISISGNTVTVDTKSVNCRIIPKKLMSEMRSSVTFLGPLLSRCSNIEFYMPGGCELGSRPIDIHLWALERLGCSFENSGGKISGRKIKEFEDTNITLPIASVGVTENVILYTVISNHTVTLKNCAREPEIVDLADFLNLCGAHILGAGTDTIVIKGVKKLHGCEHTIIPDRIEAVTLLCSIAMSEGKGSIYNCNPEHIDAPLWFLKSCGCDISVKGNEIILKSNGRPYDVPNISTQCYPGMPTDAGPLLLAYCTKCNGCAVMSENIFNSRYKYTDELNKLGANIKIFDKIAVCKGVNELVGASLKSPDLRGGAALCIGALGAYGTTVVENVKYIDRGYECIEKSLSNLGADIKRQ